MQRQRPTNRLGPIKPSDYFRQQANAARRFANNAETPQGEVAWRMIAQHWQRLVMEARSPPPRSRVKAAEDEARLLQDDDVRAHL